MGENDAKVDVAFHNVGDVAESIIGENIEHVVIICISVDHQVSAQSDMVKFGGGDCEVHSLFNLQGARGCAH